MPAKVLPDSEVDQLARQGKTDGEISDYLREHHHIDVTPSAVTHWRRRRGEELKRPRYNELLPWTVKTEHAYLYIPKMLRFEARRRAGQELTPRDLRRLEVFKEKLASANDGQGAVVHYDGDTEQGWWFVERRPEDDDIIRKP